MDLLPGYRIDETLHASARTVVYRARREEDGLAVVLKTFQPGVPVAEAWGRARHEYRLLRGLSGAGAIAVHGFDSQREMPWLVVEDFGGESLNRLLRSRTFNLLERLRIAIETSRALGEIHAGYIIHKAINPSHIVVNPATGMLKLIGFGQAVIFAPERPALPSPTVLDGDLAYFSPEQTGRMNRLLDYRSDFYSLGVMLYQLFGHALPFADTDPLDLVHCHIAKTSPPLSKINPDIPQPLAEIVAKLLAKNAEDRYQSAWGIQTDLAQCLPLAKRSGVASAATASHAFTLARYDVPSCFHIPQKLYGRENEIDALLAAFARVATGQKEMLLVSGYSGIGKTVLVREIHKPIARQRGYFISGKFDALQRTPYAAVLTAFRELVRQLLSESDSRLAEWRDKLMAVLGSSGQVIIDLIPELELIIGPQPNVSELNPTEAENRFYWIMRNFVRVFCQPEHSLELSINKA
jgi:serine/threonine protein kinase